MHVRAPAILVAARQHGETAVVARFFTEEFGIVAGYVAGGRGRSLRPVMIPGNLVDLQLSARSASQLPFAKVELTESRGPWLAEPLPAAAIGWITALTASALPEREPYPPLFSALEGTLSAICHAPSARGWASALVVAHEVVNRMVLASVIGAPLGASAGFEQDTGCINIIDFDLVPDESGNRTKIERGMIKAVNLTPANYLKNGMNLRSLEAIFTRPEEAS